MAARSRSAISRPSEAAFERARVLISAALYDLAEKRMDAVEAKAAA
jgi:hypothetical protein